jgi:hypothetical protein
LPHAAQASQTSLNGEIPCPKGSKSITQKYHNLPKQQLAISAHNQAIIFG